MFPCSLRLLGDSLSGLWLIGLLPLRRNFFWYDTSSSGCFQLCNCISQCGSRLGKVLHGSEQGRKQNYLKHTCIKNMREQSLAVCQDEMPKQIDGMVPYLPLFMPAVLLAELSLPWHQ